MEQRDVDLAEKSAEALTCLSFQGPSDSYRGNARYTWKAQELVCASRVRNTEDSGKP